jgi:hypothetical protein
MLKVSDDIRCAAVGPSQNLYLQAPYKTRDEHTYPRPERDSIASQQYFRRLRPHVN